jgi:hypothetical protein
VSAIESPGDGGGAPLFHLLNGDLCYANLDILNAPGVWRDFGVNIARSAANRPWMPALGNHETEFGVCDHAGHPGNAPGGIAAQGAAGNYWNGPYLSLSPGLTTRRPYRRLKQGEVHRTGKNATSLGSRSC